MNEFYTTHKDWVNQKPTRDAENEVRPDHPSGAAPVIAVFVAFLVVLAGMAALAVWLIVRVH